MTRYADPRYEPAGDGAAHTAVHEDTRDPDRLASAEVIFRSGAADDPRLGTPEQWTAEILQRHPHCAVAAFVTGPGACTVRVRGTGPLRLDGGPTAADPAAYASALYAWTAAGGTPEALATAGLTVRTGGGVRHRIRVSPAPG